MQQRIYQAFDSIHASEELKRGTRLFLAGKMQQKSRPRPAFARAVALACCCLLVLAGVGGYGLYATPVAAVSVDVNPSVEFSVNRFDRVVEVICYNEEAREVTQALQLENLRYDRALEQLLQSEAMAAYLAGGAPVNIAVAARDEAQTARMQQQLAACAGGWGRGVHCQAGSAQQAQEAREAGLSLGRYCAFLQWQALDPEATTQRACGMSMGQIQQEIDHCRAAQGQGGHHGQGAGQGQGTGQGQGGGHHGRGS